MTVAVLLTDPTGVGAAVARGLGALTDVVVVCPRRPRWHWSEVRAVLRPEQATELLSDPDVQLLAVGVVPPLSALGRGGDLLVGPGSAVVPPAGWTEVRTGQVMGRQLDDAGLTALRAAVQSRPDAELVEVVHVDDVVRSLLAGKPGPLTAGAVPAAAIRTALDGVRPELGSEERRSGYVWSAPACVRDLQLAAFGRRVTAHGSRRRGGHGLLHLDEPGPTEPPYDGRALSAMLPADVRGSFDDPVDDRFLALSSVNLSEALPGPATPLSLTTVGRGTAVAPLALADLIPLRDGVLNTEARARAQVVVGHRLYVNLAYIFAVAKFMPGMDEETIKQRFIGRSSEDAENLTGSGEVPGVSRVDRVRLPAAFGGALVAMMRGGELEVRAYDAAVRNVLDVAADPSVLDDAQLDSMVSAATDLVRAGWYLGGRNVLRVQMWTDLASRLAGTDTGNVSTEAGDLQSSASLQGVRTLADAARSEPAVVAALRAPDSEVDRAVRSASPAFARRLDAALHAFGHRGPGECELANPPWRERPERLLRAVASELTSTRPAGARRGAREIPQRARWAVRRALAAQGAREHSRDTLVRVTDALRRLARERGRRLADAGVLAVADDVWYLSYAELRRPPADAADRVAARRRERDRLAAIGFPGVIIGPWQPPVSGRYAPGDVIRGVGASAGVVRGTVRVVDSDTLDQLEPDEILVASVTDVGYTASFGFAGAVVVDIGGMMSHAAIVAREFGIPAVVDLGDVSTGLRTGDVVEVDGAAGTVTVLQIVDPAADHGEGVAQ